MSNSKWVAIFIFEWILIVTAFIVTSKLGWLAWWPAALFIGSRMHAMYEIGHLGSHRLIFRSKNDDWFTRVVFTPLGIDLEKFRKFHLAHHRHLGHFKLDPERGIQERFRERWEEPRIRDSIKDSMGLTLDETFYTVKHFTNTRQLVILGILIVLGVWVFGEIVFLWLLAMATGLPLAHRLRARTEHLHLTVPGITIYKHKPAMWKRVWFLPYGVWQHYEHHRSLK